MTKDQIREHIQSVAIQAVKAQTAFDDGDYSDALDFLDDVLRDAEKAYEQVSKLNEDKENA